MAGHLHAQRLEDRRLKWSQRLAVELARVDGSVFMLLFCSWIAARSGLSPFTREGRGSGRPVGVTLGVPRRPPDRQAAQ